MNKRPRRRIGVIAGVAALAILATGCSVANTDSSHIALHYTGGSLSSQTFKDCVPAGKREVNGVSDKHFYYPANIAARTFTFSEDKGADSAPLTASTKNTQELVVRGTISFTFSTDCTPFTDASGKEWPGGKLQKFHEAIGRKTWGEGPVYSEDTETDVGKGWLPMLSVYIKNVVDRAIDNEALKYTWQQLYSDTTTKAQWEKDVVAAIPDLVKAQAGEDFFTVTNVLLQKPDIPGALKEQLTAKEAAILRGEASAEDQKAAKNWPGGIQAYLAYQRQLAINKAIAEGKVKVIPVPDGATLMLPVE
jgi:hypothetical protein